MTSSPSSRPLTHALLVAACAGLILPLTTGCPKAPSGSDRSTPAELVLAPTRADEPLRYRVEARSGLSTRQDGTDVAFHQVDKLDFVMRDLGPGLLSDRFQVQWELFQPSLSAEEPDPELQARLSASAVGTSALVVRDLGDNRNVLGLEQHLPHPTDRQVPELALQLLSIRMPPTGLQPGDVVHESFLLRGHGEAGELARRVEVRLEYIGLAGRGASRVARFRIEGENEVDVRFRLERGAALYTEQGPVRGTLDWNLATNRPANVHLEVAGEGNLRVANRESNTLEQMRSRLELDIELLDMGSPAPDEMSQELRAELGLLEGESVFQRRGASEDELTEARELIQESLAHAPTAARSRAARMLALQYLLAGEPQKALEPLANELREGSNIDKSGEDIHALIGITEAALAVQRHQDESLLRDPESAARGFLLQGQLGQREAITAYLHPGLLRDDETRSELLESWAPQRRGDARSPFGRAIGNLLRQPLQLVEVGQDLATVLLQPADGRGPPWRIWLLKTDAGWKVVASEGREGLLCMAALLHDQLSGEAPDAAPSPVLLQILGGLLDELPELLFSGFELVSSARHSADARARLASGLLSLFTGQEERGASQTEALLAERETEPLGRFLGLLREWPPAEPARADARARLLVLEQELPESESVSYQLALLEEQDGEYESAERRIRSLLATSGDQLPLLEALGNLLYSQDQMDEAIQAYERALDRSPFRASVCNNLAWLLAIRGDRLDEARRLVEVALQQEPENLAFLDTLAEVWFRLGETERALEVTSRGLELDPGDQQLLLQQDRFQNALEQPSSP